MSTDASLIEARNLYAVLLAGSDLSREIFAKIADDLGIPVATARALCSMSEPAPMSDLASKLKCDKSYVTGLADQLESNGLVRRVPGPDRRIKMLELTPKGVELRDRLELEVERQSPAMTALTPDERKELLRLLGKISGCH